MTSVSFKGIRPSATVFWLFQITFWGVWSLLKFLAYQEMPHPGGLSLFLSVRVLLLFCLTLAFHHISTLAVLRRHEGIAKWIPLLFVSIAATSCIGFFFPYIVAGAAGVLDSVLLTEPRTWRSFFAMDIVVGLWFAVYCGLCLYERLGGARLYEAYLLGAAREVELRLLQSQLNPHFLFNALNIIQAKADNDEVREITGNLASCLRFSLNSSRTLEPLGRELDFLERYLGIQQARFGDQLDCSVRVEEAARSILVPPMLIQPLLENAIKYGQRTSELPTRVRVTAAVVEGVLTVSVVNTGTWVERDSSEAPGIGLENLLRRLHLLLGEKSTLDITCDAEGVSVVVTIPADPIREEWELSPAPGLVV